MTEDIVKHDSEEKAWQYLREIMHNDEQYERLRNGLSIEVVGSEAGHYIVYPNGHVVRLDVDEPALGRIHQSRMLPFPDVLCTIYAWITHDEKRFRKNWGCGNIHVRTKEEDQREREELHENLYEYHPHHYHSVFPDGFTSFLIALPICAIIAFFVFPTFLGALNTANNPANSTVVSNATTPSIANATITAFTSLSFGSPFFLVFITLPLFIIVAYLLLSHRRF